MMLDRIRLSHLLVIEAIAWAAACWYFNGAGILLYIGLHAVVTGVFFALFVHQMRRALRKDHDEQEPWTPGSRSESGLESTKMNMSRTSLSAP